MALKSTGRGRATRRMMALNRAHRPQSVLAEFWSVTVATEQLLVRVITIRMQDRAREYADD